MSCRWHRIEHYKKIGKSAKNLERWALAEKKSIQAREEATREERIALEKEWLIEQEIAELTKEQKKWLKTRPSFESMSDREQREYILLCDFRRVTRAHKVPKDPRPASDRLRILKGLAPEWQIDVDSKGKAFWDYKPI